jgi:hypothetical protein
VEVAAREQPEVGLVILADSVLAQPHGLGAVVRVDVERYLPGTEAGLVNVALDGNGRASANCRPWSQALRQRGAARARQLTVESRHRRCAAANRKNRALLPTEAC